MHLYTPLQAMTGALHTQPSTMDGSARIECCGCLTSNFEVYIDTRGALDAPDMIPYGAVRAMLVGDDAALLIAHVGRRGHLT